MKKIKSIVMGLMVSVAAFSQTMKAPLASSSQSDKIQDRLKKEGLKVYLASDSSQWLKATVVMQAQARYNWNNPGSNVFGYPESKTADAGYAVCVFSYSGRFRSVFLYMRNSG